MKKLKLLIPLIILLGIGIRCKQDSSILDPIEYKRWIENPTNGLCVKKKVGNFEYIAQFKPSDYIVVQEEKQKTLNTSLVEERKAALGDESYYFNLRIKTIDKAASPLTFELSSEQAYQDRLGYFVYDMQQDLYLLQNEDTIYCTLYNFARNYETAPFLDFALAFSNGNKINLKEDFTFILEDKKLGTGIIKMNFEKNNLLNTPVLKTIE